MPRASEEVIVKGQIVFFCLLLGVVTPLRPLFAQGDQKYTSPRIFALQKELEAGNGAAVEKFWDEIVKQGIVSQQSPRTIAIDRT